MKSYTYVSRVLLSLSLFLSVSVVAFSQDDKKENVNALISSGRFVFRAQVALPSGGQAVQLTTPYDLVISKDSVVAYLPYYGRAYSITPAITEGGIKFNSREFDYKIKERRKGGWDITIDPEDARDIQEIYLTVSETGYANLQVLSLNRQPITFNGYITGL